MKNKTFVVNKKLLRKNYGVYWFKIFIPTLILSIIWYYYIMNLKLSNVFIIFNLIISLLFTGISVFSGFNVIKALIGTIKQDIEKLDINIEKRNIKKYSFGIVNGDLSEKIYNYEIIEIEKIVINRGYIKLLGKFTYDYKILSDYHLPYKYEKKDIKHITIQRVLDNEEYLLNMLNYLKGIK